MMISVLLRLHWPDDMHRTVRLEMQTIFPEQRFHRSLYIADVSFVSLFIHLLRHISENLLAFYFLAVFNQSTDICNYLK